MSFLKSFKQNLTLIETITCIVHNEQHPIWRPYLLLRLYMQQGNIRWEYTFQYNSDNRALESVLKCVPCKHMMQKSDVDDSNMCQNAKNIFYNNRCKNWKSSRGWLGESWITWRYLCINNCQRRLLQMKIAGQLFSKRHDTPN